MFLTAKDAKNAQGKHLLLCHLCELCSPASGVVPALSPPAGRIRLPARNFVVRFLSLLRHCKRDQNLLHLVIGRKNKKINFL
jgi:hypothetical protein